MFVVIFNYRRRWDPNHIKTVVRMQPRVDGRGLPFHTREDALAAAKAMMVDKGVGCIPVDALVYELVAA